MKVLEFEFRGQIYRVDENGFIKANGLKDYSDTWVFLGGSSHHWHTHITVSKNDAFERPDRLNGCLGWDSDSGTVRQWRGLYAGKLPRIRNATVITI